MCRTSRLLAAAFVVCFAGALGGCSSIPAPSWDPTDLLDFLDTKKKTPGERKPVFPEGVPGITQGVPPELMKGAQQPAAAADAQATATVPPAEAQPAPPSAKRSRAAAKRPSAVEIAPDDVNVDDAPQSPGRQAQQPQANPFPAPLPR
ncbi:hypothetical protein [Bradyrhizobium sp. LHD-71]|uniref:hypothetical protein n=1 Tax=Bradyrhizobium sp. LHD-71 TaxID=3072141 RepID=UPI00280F5EC0|nr:hypothetical protein [Bradyrhizobium sp. LHD-71]MDQ8729857.1 hypothetical protein [Bradyrhizobium sp. LHD-71]